MSQLNNFENRKKIIDIKLYINVADILTHYDTTLTEEQQKQQNKYIVIANDRINLLSGNKINQKGFDNFNIKEKSLIRSAVGRYFMWLVNQGQEWFIGNVSFSTDGLSVSQSGATEPDYILQAVYDFLQAAKLYKKTDFFTQKNFDCQNDTGINNFYPSYFPDCDEYISYRQGNRTYVRRNNFLLNGVKIENEFNTVGDAILNIKARTVNFNIKPSPVLNGDLVLYSFIDKENFLSLYLPIDSPPLNDKGFRGSIFYNEADKIVMSFIIHEVFKNYFAKIWLSPKPSTRLLKALVYEENEKLAIDYFDSENYIKSLLSPPPIKRELKSLVYEESGKLAIDYFDSENYVKSLINPIPTVRETKAVVYEEDGKLAVDYKATESAVNNVKVVYFEFKVEKNDTELVYYIDLDKDFFDKFNKNLIVKGEKNIETQVEFSVWIQDNFYFIEGNVLIDYYYNVRLSRVEQGLQFEWQGVFYFESESGTENVILNPGGVKDRITLTISASVRDVKYLRLTRYINPGS